MLIILKPQPWQQVCIKDESGRECTPEYWCEDEPFWSVSPTNDNHIILTSACLTWSIECGEGGEIIDAPGLVCDIPVSSDEGDYRILLSLSEQEELNVIVKYEE